jgi:hypothetical protein
LPGNDTASKDSGPFDRVYTEQSECAPFDITQDRQDYSKSEDDSTHKNDGIDNKHHLNYNVLTEGDKCLV